MSRACVAIKWHIFCCCYRRHREDVIPTWVASEGAVQRELQRLRDMLHSADPVEVVTRLKRRLADGDSTAASLLGYLWPEALKEMHSPAELLQAIRAAEGVQPRGQVDDAGQVSHWSQLPDHLARTIFSHLYISPTHQAQHAAATARLVCKAW